MTERYRRQLHPETTPNPQNKSEEGLRRRTVKDPFKMGLLTPPERFTMEEARAAAIAVKAEQAARKASEKN